MCGIFGSNNFSKFTSLYEINKQRGSFSFGLVGINHDNNTPYVVKRPGNINLDHLPSHVESSYDIYLGHTQAPTSSARAFNTSTTHPFEFGDWLIAHNGIINNYKKIIKKHEPDHKNPVDSSIIPVLISKFTKQHDILDSIIKTFNEINGLAAIWAYNTKTRKIYMCRMGSTLYYDGECTFSSLKLPGMEELPDNRVYELTGTGNINEIGSIKSNSSFFIIE